MLGCDRFQIVSDPGHFAGGIGFHLSNKKLVHFTNGTLFLYRAVCLSVVDHAPGVRPARPDFGGNNIVGAPRGTLTLGPADVRYRNVLACDLRIDHRIIGSFHDPLVLFGSADQKTGQLQIGAFP